MLLVLDVGNTNIKMGIYNGKNLEFQARLSSDRFKTEDEYAVEFYSAFRVYKVPVKEIDGVIIGSVVPQITVYLRNALRTLTGVEPILVGPGVKTGRRPCGKLRCGGGALPLPLHYLYPRNGNDNFRHRRGKSVCRRVHYAWCEHLAQRADGEERPAFGHRAGSAGARHRQEHRGLYEKRRCAWHGGDARRYVRAHRRGA